MPATHQRPGLLATLSVSLICVYPLVGQSALPPVDPNLRARFGFLDPIVKKINHGTNLLQAVRWANPENAKPGDTNPGHGGDHVLVNNPHRSRIDDFHYAGKKLQSTTISTDGDLRGLQTADVDGDAKPDLLMLTARGRLVIQLGDKSKTALPELEVGTGAIYDCLRCDDLDGDGRQDAVVLTRDGLRTVTAIAGTARVSAAQPVFASRLRSFDLLDLDGDGRRDVVLFSNDDKMQVHIKLGLAAATTAFGPWILLGTEKFTRVFAGTRTTGRRTLAAIHARTYRVVEYELSTKTGAQRPALNLTALPKTAKPRAFAYGDVDNDGDADLVLSDPARARLILLLDDGGRFRVRHTATLAGVQSLAIGDIDGDGKNDLVQASAEEATIAWTAGSGDLEAFPTRLADLPKIDKKPGLPVVLTIEDGTVLAVLRNKSYAAAVFQLAPDQAPIELGRIGRMRRDPRRLLCADLDGQHGTDLAYVVPSEGLQMMFRTADGKFEPGKNSETAGFTKRMEDGALSLTGSATQRALLCVRERYARKFRFDATGQPTILAQDGGPDGNPSMAMGTVLADGTRLFLDRKNHQLHRLTKDQPAVSFDIPQIAPLYLLPHGEDAIIIGGRGVLRIPFGRSFELTAVRRHEPPIQKTRYFDGMSADFDGDGKLELVLLDHHGHGVHILVPDGAQLRRGLSFPVYESSANDRRPEPHGLAHADVNGDGRQDLLLLCHDRILIYFQER